MARTSRDEERIRIAAMSVAGVVAGLATGGTISWWHAPAYGWGVAATVFSVLAWRSMHRLDAEATKRHASGESPSRRAREMFLLVSTVFSLAAIVLLLVKGSESEGGAQVVEAVAALAVIIASWVLIHMVYTLRYANVHFDEGQRGSVDFNEEGDPRYLDFAYLSFTVGMTYAVSDTDVDGSEMRRTVLTHSLYSFIFGTVILAMAVNLAVTVV